MDSYEKILNISNNIISKYIELLVSPVYDIDLDVRSEIIDSILELVLDEYKLIHSINKIDIDRYVEYISSNDNNDAIVRIKNKLTDYKEILNGIYISTFELGLDKVDRNMKFSIYDAIISMINIDTIKCLYNKIYSLKSYCDGDDNFIELLKFRLNFSKIEFLFNTNVSEMLALYYNTSIEDIPRIDEKKIRNKIKLLNNKKYNSLVENCVIIFITRIVQELSKIRTVKNNASDVFKYLVYITQIELLLEYLDKNKLHELYDFCIKMSNDENIASMNNIKRLVKNKIDS